MYVLVNDQKVFFKGVDPKVDPHQLKFTTDFPLKEGNNNVLVVAREDAEFASRKTLVIRRRPRRGRRQAGEARWLARRSRASSRALVVSVDSTPGGSFGRPEDTASWQGGRPFR